MQTRNAKRFVGLDRNNNNMTPCFTFLHSCKATDSNNTERFTMSDALRLQWKLTEARNENLQENHFNRYSGGNDNYNNRSTNYKPRIASITREQQDERERRKQMIQREVIQLLEEGYSVDQTINILEGYIRPSEVSRIAEFNEGRLKFLRTGRLIVPNGMVGITIG